MLAMLVVAASLSSMPVGSVGLRASETEAAQPDRAIAEGIAAQIQAMRKLEFLAGEWEGPASYDSGRGTWVPLRQTEIVEKKLGGRVLLVEGIGRLPTDDGKGRVVFEALATISYDPRAKEYRMRAFGPEGAIDPKIEIGDKSLVWSFEAMGSQRRYTLKIDEQGRWHEIGERSSDGGKTWVKFVELTVEKKSEG